MSPPAQTTKSPTLRGIIAHIAVLCILMGTAVCARVGSWLDLIRRRRQPEPGKGLQVLLVGTFYNENWLRSHGYPLSAARTIDRVYVVTDEPLFPLSKIAYVCPPRWLTKVVGRMVTRFFMVLYVTIRHRPHVLMGYHIMPNALLCLAMGKLFGARSIYQMTGGPIQIVGGGHGSENVLLRQLGRPSKLREWWLFHLVRQFDWVAVRGRKAVKFVEDHRLHENCIIIPGSVDCQRFAPDHDAKVYDLVSVGRLVQPKRYDRLIQIAAALKNRGRQIRVAVIGGGPLQDRLSAYARKLGVAENVDFLGQKDDIVPCLRAARAFIITSENEGLSIAMVEAMATGLPAIVPDVGDLADVVRDGETGLLIDPDHPSLSGHRIAKLLGDADELARMSKAARRCILHYNAVGAVAARWDKTFADLVDGARGVSRVPASTPVRTSVEPSSGV